MSNNNFNQIKGIENPANNCYLNSILQLLYSCPDFLRIIQNINSINQNDLLIKFMKEFIRLYSIEQNTVIGDTNKIYIKRNTNKTNNKINKIYITSAFTNTFPKTIFTGISHSGQEDAGELLIQILQKLNEKYENNIIANLFYPKKGTILYNIDGKLEFKANDNDFDTFKIPIYDEFEIEKYYNEYNLNPLIKKNLDVNLQKLIDNYFEIKIKPTQYRLKLEESNNFIPVADQICLYGNMPRYLIISLNRFSVIQNKTFKINSQLQSYSGIIQIPFYNSESILSQKKMQNYSLIGFIVHLGNNVKGGHYIGYFYKFINEENKYYSFNDKNVAEITMAKMDEQFKSAYIFFYRKIDSPVNSMESGSTEDHMISIPELIKQKLNEYDRKENIIKLFKPSINKPVVKNNSIHSINQINSIITKIKNKKNTNKEVALNELKRIIEQLLKSNSLENIFLLKHIIHNIFNKTSTNKSFFSSIRSVFIYFINIFSKNTTKKNSLNSELIKYIIQQYKEHQNGNTTSLYPIETDLLIELFLTNNQKLKEEMKNLFELSISDIIDAEYRDTKLKNKYYVLEKDQTGYFILINKNNRNERISIELDLSLIPCVESGAGGHAGAFINVIEINKETLNKSTSINYKNVIYCAKIINPKKPNEFLFYRYIYKKENEGKYEDFKEYICQYKGIIEYEHDGKKIKYMIIENAKSNVRNAITIDFKVGSITYLYGENNTEFRNKSKYAAISNRGKIYTQGTLNQITMSRKIYARIEGITGIVYKLDLVDYNATSNKIAVVISGKLIIFDPSQKKVISDKILYYKNIKLIAFSPAGENIAIVLNNKILIWNYLENNEIITIDVDESTNLVIWEDDSSILYNEKKNIIRYRPFQSANITLINQKEILQNNYINTNIKLFALFPNNEESLIAIYIDNNIYIYKEDNNVLIKQHNAPLNVNNGNCISFSSDGKYIIVGTDNGIKIWSINENNNNTLNILLDNKIILVKFNPIDNNLFLSGTVDGTIQIWEKKSDNWTLKKTYNKANSNPNAISWYENNSIIYDLYKDKNLGKGGLKEGTKCYTKDDSGKFKYGTIKKVKGGRLKKVGFPIKSYEIEYKNGTKSIKTKKDIYLLKEYKLKILKFENSLENIDTNIDTNNIFINKLDTKLLNIVNNNQYKNFVRISTSEDTINEYLNLINNTANTLKLKNDIKTILDPKSFKQIHGMKKTKKMTKHPIKLFDILYFEKIINLDVLNGFQNDLYNIINGFINNNFNEMQKENGKYFSFVGSSLLFIIGDSKIEQNKKEGYIKLIDFGHPVNLFMEHVKLMDKDNSDTYKNLVKTALIDYSLGVINLYFIVSYFILFKKYIIEEKNKRNVNIRKNLKFNLDRAKTPNKILINKLNNIFKIYSKIKNREKDKEYINLNIIKNSNINNNNNNK